MIVYKALLFVHITSFALWMGAVVASLLVVRTLESRLNSTAAFWEGDDKLLRGYISKEVKLVDVVFTAVILSGVLLAQFYTGWTTWVAIKMVLMFAQFAATIGFIHRYVRSLTYPTTPDLYRRWYVLFTISLSFFTVILLVVFFGR